MLNLWKRMLQFPDKCKNDHKHLENKARGNWKSEYANKVADGCHKHRADTTQKRLWWNNCITHTAPSPLLATLTNSINQELMHFLSITGLCQYISANLLASTVKMLLHQSSKFVLTDEKCKHVANTSMQVSCLADRWGHNFTEQWRCESSQSILI